MIHDRPDARALLLLLMGLLVPLWAQDAMVGNAGFESATLDPWKPTGHAVLVSDDSHSGKQSLMLGPAGASALQQIDVLPLSTYRLTAWMRSSSGAADIRLGVSDYGGPPMTVATPSVAWTQLSIVFHSGSSAHQATIVLQTATHGWVDDVGIEYLGLLSAKPVSTDDNTIVVPEPRVPVTQLGVTQLSNARMDWLLDAKFGMFIHWGLYSGPGRGEWLMYNEAITPEKYRAFATEQSGDDYFAADQFDPSAWAALAKEAGMKWMCLTARHHDGFNLFDVPFPGAFTSMQTHHRDFVAEYVAAVRAEHLGVGLYFSPLNWRYPGYFDISGTDCKPNKWNYRTDPAHKENARQMKEENYVAVKQLLTAYGHIDYLFWDGGWLGMHGSDADAAPFHEPGKFLDPANAWSIDPAYEDHDPATGKALGIMGMVRRYQPDAITNYRYGWIGDMGEQEGGATITGPLRQADLCDKCLSMHDASWGYSKESVAQGKVMSTDEIIRMLADCVIRNMTLLLNVGPDRHGVIPDLEEQRLRGIGRWLNDAGEAVYGTRGGPWQPVDGQYGYCWKGHVIYVHILQGFQGDTFTLPPVGPLMPVAAWQVTGSKDLHVSVAPDRTVTVTGIDRSASPVDTIIAVGFDQDVMAHAHARP